MLSEYEIIGRQYEIFTQHLFSILKIADRQDGCKAVKVLKTHLPEVPIASERC